MKMSRKKNERKYAYDAKRFEIMATSRLMSCNFMILTSHKKKFPFDDR